MKSETVTLPSGATATLKTRVHFDDHDAARQDAMREEGGQGLAAYAIYLRNLAVRMVIDWTATDDDGQALSISPEGFGELESDDGDVLIDHVTARLHSKSESAPPAATPEAPAARPRKAKAPRSRSLTPRGKRPQ